ncbi:MAG: hypothetical protein ACI9GM_001527 [Salibacteraceae bacterium]|jgi:hypothetical protein
MKQYLREHFLNHLFQALSEITFDNQIVCYLYSLALVLLLIKIIALNFFSGPYFPSL